MIFTGLTAKPNGVLEITLQHGKMINGTSKETEQAVHMLT